jgi:MFS family permease
MVNARWYFMNKKLWNRDFILLLQGGAVSMIGDLMYSVAIGYWVYEKTGSNSLMGIMSSISMFVTMFLSPFSGSIVDKLNRKWVLVGMDLFQSVIMLTVGILAYTEKLNVPLVLIAAFLAALGSVFYSPAASSVMLEITPRDDLVRGQSIFSGSSSFINLVGSALSGLMVAFLGVPLIVIINGLSNLYSAFSELFVTVPKSINQGEKITVGRILTDTKAAVKMIFSEPCLRIFVPCALILNLLSAGAFTLMLPFCLEKSFSVDSYGYLMSIWTTASLICVVLLGAIKLPSKVRFWVMAIGFTFAEVFLILGYLSKEFIVLAVFAFLGALFNTAGNTVFNASLMLALPEENRNAILGFIQSASVGGTALSAVLYGILGDVFPLYIVFAAGSFISLAPMLFLCFHPTTKKFVLTH